MEHEAGFTVIELIIVIVVIGILLTIGISTQFSVLASSRDNERASDTASIARLLESVYTNQSSDNPSYPYTTDFVNAAAGHTAYTATSDAAIFQAPNQPNSSVKAAASPSTPSTTGANAMTPDQYIYQPITASNQLCVNDTQACVRFNLYYMSEAGKRIYTLTSGHQQ